MRDRLYKKIYSDKGVFTIYHEKLKNSQYIYITLKNKITLLLKKIIINKDNSDGTNAVLYYNSSKDLKEFFETNCITDIKNSLKGVPGYEHIALIEVDQNVFETSLDDMNEETVNEYIHFVLSSSEERKNILNNKNKNNKDKVLKKYSVPKTTKKESSMYIETNIGEVEIRQNSNIMPVGFSILLDNNMIALIEEKENKLVFKRYPNKDVVFDDDYFNVDIYEIEKLSNETIFNIINEIEY